MITLKLLKCMCEVWEYGKEHHPTSVWRLVERTGAADDTSKETPLFVLIWALFGATWLCVTSSFESQDMAKSGKGFLIYPALCKCSFFFLHKVKFCLNDQFVYINSFVAHPSIGFNSSVVPQATVAVGALAALAASGVKRTTRRAQAGWSFERITWKCDIVIWVICI